MRQSVIVQLLLYTGVLFTGVVSAGGQQIARPMVTNDQSAIRFAVATIKPSKSHGYNLYFTTDRFVAVGATLQTLVQEAYNTYAGNSVVGGPTWASRDQFDVQAILDPEDVPRFRGSTPFNAPRSSEKPV